MNLTKVSYQYAQSKTRRNSSPVRMRVVPANPMPHSIILFAHEDFFFWRKSDRCVHELTIGN
ncbi:hypothetical protein QJS04_geneDACA003093 [Acorus gramineus]|uniref:Uncharacterized protein n=1 Tax=Acorus gramineus TaxID=55184 RepID=A0AAV9BVQ6_ACOGR|nr:hypothetical protein QJS04_geneDACA003093 [Acorus gramineus]